MVRIPILTIRLFKACANSTLSKIPFNTLNSSKVGKAVTEIRFQKYSSVQTFLVICLRELSIVMLMILSRGRMERDVEKKLMKTTATPESEDLQVKAHKGVDVAAID